MASVAVSQLAVGGVCGRSVLTCANFVDVKTLGSSTAPVIAATSESCALGERIALRDSL